MIDAAAGAEADAVAAESSSEIAVQRQLAEAAKLASGLVAWCADTITKGLRSH